MAGKTHNKITLKYLVKFQTHSNILRELRYNVVYAETDDLIAFIRGEDFLLEGYTVTNQEKKRYIGFETQSVLRTTCKRQRTQSESSEDPKEEKVADQDEDGDEDDDEDRDEDDGVEGL